jgi:hypothetical protein
MELNLSYIPRLPWEMRYAIYMFIDIDTRLKLLTQKKTKIIRCLNHLPLTDCNIFKLINLFEHGFRTKIFNKSVGGKYNIKSNLTKLLPSSRYKAMGHYVEMCNPIFTMLEKECTLKTMYGFEPNWSKKQTIMNKLRGCFDIIPSLYGYNTFTIKNNKSVKSVVVNEKKFNYLIRIYLFKFIALLHVATKEIQIEIDKEDFEKAQLIVKRNFKRLVMKRIKPMYMRFQRNRRIKEIHEHKEAVTRERIQAKQAKLEAKQAKLEATLEAKQAKLEAKLEAKQAKLEAKQNVKKK